ncbi:hypothetical protein CY35_17G037600 [Sphagnum magellanicum]|nr:hypothetical protein CY35_17G037600 [Sphagnum magellanicum]KAH9535126.1 hypothetical protein CY35_17G037600 [Sphagnum magellanicum]
MATEQRRKGSGSKKKRKAGFIAQGPGVGQYRRYFLSICCHLWRYRSITCPAIAAACIQTMTSSMNKRRKLSICDQCSGSVATATKYFGLKLTLILTLTIGTVACLSANRCLADFCGALHCDYVDGLSNSKWKKTTCKPAVVDRNRHLCEVLANNCFPKEQSAAAQWLNDFFKRQFCDAHTCDKQLQPFPHGSVKREDSSLYFAICILTLFILAIVYFVVCLQNRDLSMTRISLRRLSQHTHIKMRKAKLT